MCTHPMEKRRKKIRGVKGTFPGESVKGVEVEDARARSVEKREGRSRLAAGRWLKEGCLSNQLP